MKNSSKYWFSWQQQAKGFRMPVSREGWIFTTGYLVVGFVAILATMPRAQDPTLIELIPLAIVAIILISVYITVSTLKAQPRPPKK